MGSLNFSILIFNAAEKYIYSKTYVDLLQKNELKKRIVSNCVFQVMLHISLLDSIFAFLQKKQPLTGSSNIVSDFFAKMPQKCYQAKKMCNSTCNTQFDRTDSSWTFCGVDPHNYPNECTF